MIKKPFFGLTKQRFNYDSLGQDKVELKKIAVPGSVTYLIESKVKEVSLPALKPGDKIKLNQRIVAHEERGEYAVSSAAGVVSRVSAYSGDFGKNYAAVTLTTNSVAGEAETEAWLEGVSGELTLDNALNYFGCLPGKPQFNVFTDPKQPIKTIVVLGVDQDIGVTTNQYVVQHESGALNAGISWLKKITQVEYVVMALPDYLTKRGGAVGGASGVEIRVIDQCYPSANLFFVINNVLGKCVSTDKTWEELGIAVFSAEAVAAIGKALSGGQPPGQKIMTLIKKDGSKMMVEALIGTPLADIFQACNISLNDRDRIIVGGPLTGSAVFSEDYPVLPDTDAVVVQDAADIAPISEYPCINCGECIRICPAKVPVNMLVRFCEAGQYEDAAEMYDLYSCIECGLCSVVCVSRMPIFQHIKLAKYELRKNKEAELLAAEESNE